MSSERKASRCRWFNEWLDLAFGVEDDEVDSDDRTRSDCCANRAE